ncbi:MULTISPECIES: VanW family protein [unclassified Selenomonas]|uniref:VanW family protein n=1 Tax=unclassified Selenomonas TaxID=2637378 RepID=UPI0006921EBD|nr:Vancomycin resistance protein YoaR, contains peptidoglycan-binding and VanW domains [Selenomonas ruminantium]
MKSTLNTKTKYILFALLVCALLTVAIPSVVMAVVNQNRVAMGVYYGANRLSGMSREQVQDFFRELAAKKLDKDALILTYKDKTWKYSPEDIGLEVHADEAAEAAWRVGHDPEKNFAANAAEQLESASVKRDIALEVTYDAQAVEEKLAAIGREINVQPQDAYLTLQADGSFQLHPGHNGSSLPQAELMEKIGLYLKELHLPLKLAITPEVNAPSIKNSDLSSMDTILASYTTSYAPGDRGHNIELAAGKLNQRLVRTGEVFSFNNAVGTRTRENGFRDAGVIIDGRLAQDSGGGVCQVSSTLYNAILLAGLTPVERTAHFFPSTYCPPGRDATVADGLLDFTFRNQLPHNVYLFSSCSGTTVTIYVAGTRADLNGCQITLQTEGSSMTPSVYRVWTKNGQGISNEFLHTDHYDTPQE